MEHRNSREIAAPGRKTLGTRRTAMRVMLGHSKTPRNAPFVLKFSVVASTAVLKGPPKQIV